MKIFVIDDEPFQREATRDFITNKFPQAEVNIYPNGEEALRDIYKTPDCVILDYYLNLENPNAANGLQILDQVKNVLPEVPVILLSGQEDPQVAVNVIKHGAYDYVVKNESSFSRLQILLEKIYGYHELKKNLGFQRIMNIVLLLLFLGLLIGFIVEILM